LKLLRRRRQPVAIILATLVAVNVIANSFFPGLEELTPAPGLGLWVAILVTAPLRAPDWKVLREATKGALFLVTLVALASLMPVGRLPPPSLLSVFGLGLLSEVFDPHYLPTQLVSGALSCGSVLLPVWRSRTCTRKEGPL
jgi:hypothetical protein